MSEIGAIVHGTTMATNAVLERKTAIVGLITTRGFRDVLEMRRRQRPQTYGMFGRFDPLVPRHLRLEVDERVDSKGTVERPLDEEGVRRCAGQLREAGTECVAISFINAFANPAHERRAAEIVREVWPEAFVSISSDVLPEIKEFERTSTTVLNAAVQPIIDRYLIDLEGKLAALGSKAKLSIVQSNGGIASTRATREKAVSTILSGPAAGVTGAAYIASREGIRNIVTFDMGGTSLDTAVVLDGQPQMASETKLEFGLVLKTPMIQIDTIATGGGSIAHVDRGGFLRVGPDSAGADPGPVAYGRGGTLPTITDANLVLGRINPDRAIGGATARFDLEGAKRALLEHVGKPLNLSVYEAAEAVIHVANARMAGAVRLATVEKGHDPRKFTILAYGGAGPLHAGSVMKSAGVAQTLVPLYPGLTSALGCAVGNLQYDFSQTLNRELDAGTFLQATAIWSAQAGQGKHALADETGHLTEQKIICGADMHFRGQTHALFVRFGGQPRSLPEMLEAFEQAYQRAFGMLLDLPVWLSNIRTTVVGVRPKLELSGFAQRERGASALIGHRQVFTGGAFVDAQVHERALLAPGALIHGPAIVEQPDTTVFIDAGLTAKVDDHLNILLRSKE